MSSDDHQRPLEERLRSEADELLRMHGDAAASKAIAERCRRRAKRRRRIVEVSGVVAALVVAFVVLQIVPSSRDDPGALVKPPVIAAGGGSDGPTNSSIAESPQEELVGPVGMENVLPICVIQWGMDGEPVVMPGLYVAEPDVALSFEELTPGERYAVQQVLGTVEQGYSSHTL